MGSARTVFGAVLLMIAVLAIVSSSPLHPGEGGGEHARFETLRQGHGQSDLPERHLWLGWALGLANFAVVAALIAFGARRGGGLRGLGRPLAVVTAACVLAWTLLMLAYRDFAAGDHALLLGFPRPTTLMLFLVWPLSAGFALLYSIGFERWVYTPEDRARYRALLEARRARTGEAVADLDR